MLKICGECGTQKDVSAFYPRPRANPNQLSAYSSDCKKCVRSLRAKYVQTNAAKVHRTNRNSSLVHNYGITIEQYNVLFEAQAGFCPGCDRHQGELSKSLCVDHDHVTGAVRGLLCNECNLILGYAKDNIQTLVNLGGYLEKTIQKYLEQTNPELADKNTNVVELEFPKKVG